MKLDVDINELANIVIAKHGANGRGHAQDMAEKHLHTQDHEGHVLWLRILEAVEELLRADVAALP